MSLQQNQVCGKEPRLSTSPLELITISGVKSTTEHQDCIDDHVVSTPDSSFLGQPTVASSDQVGTKSPVDPGGPCALLSTSSPGVSTHERRKSEEGDDDLQCPKPKDATVLQRLAGGETIQMRGVSITGNGTPGRSDKAQETPTADSQQQIGPSKNLPISTTAAVPAAVVTAGKLLPAHESPTPAAPIPHAKSRQRTETLPRLALLDLPLLGITPPTQDINAPPQTLERIQDSPPPDASAPGSSVDLDLREACQFPHPSPDPPQQERETCHFSHPPPDPPRQDPAALNVSAAQADNDLDDDVTFIISVPRRRKKKRKIDGSTNRASEEQVGNSNFTTADSDLISSPTSENPISIANRSSYAPQTPGGEDCGAAGELPIATSQHAVFTPDPSGSLPLAPICMTPSTTAQSSQPEESVPPEWVLGITSKTSEPATGGENHAVVESPQISPLTKRKVDETKDREDDSTTVKLPKILNDQLQGRTLVALANQEQGGQTQPSTGYATTSDILATSSTGSRVPNPEILNPLQNCNDDTLVLSTGTLTGQNNLISSTRAPRLVQSNLPHANALGQVPNQNALRDIRRRPSLYSIPSWPTPPVRAVASDTQQRPSATHAHAATGMHSHVTQSGKSPLLASGQNSVSVSQPGQRGASDHAMSSTSTSQVLNSLQSRTETSTQPIVMHQPLGSYDGTAHPLLGRNMFSISPWTGQPFLALGQQMHQDHFHTKPQQLTLTPQEYARRLHAQYAQMSQQRELQFQQQARFTVGSPQMRQAEPQLQTADQSQTSPSPNLLVDIAQTCQAMFPFARVAERHNQPVKKVFDAFSAIIQLPLLQQAADRRRNGKLGTARLKDFREATKAVSEAHEKKRKAEREGAKMRNELAEPPVKKPRGRPKANAGKSLLGQAISNSQKNAGGSK